MFTGLALLGQELEFHTPYYICLGIAGIFALYQQLLIRDRQPTNCFRAFLNNNWLGATIFIGILLDYIYSA